MDTDSPPLYAVVELGKTVEALPVVSSTESRCVLASGADGQSRTKVEREKVFFLTRNPVGRKEVQKAFAEARGMEYGSLWEASFAADTLDGMATRLKGANDDDARLLVVCAYFRERPLFAGREGERFRPKAPNQAELIIQSKRKALEQERQDAKLMARIAEGDLSMVEKADINPILFEKGSRLGEMIERQGVRTREGKAALLLRYGILSSELDYHRRSAMHELLVESKAEQGMDEIRAPFAVTDGMTAVSCDHEGTIEIDDALTLQRDREGTLTLLAHLCSPVGRIRTGDDLDALMQERMSTVYMPQEKFMMLPAEACGELTLSEGRERAVITVGVEVDLGTGACTGIEPRFETIRIARNSFFHSFSSPANLADLGFRDEHEANAAIEILRRHRNVRHEPRRKRCAIHVGKDGSIEAEAGVPGVAEDVVAEMMILSNARLARLAYENKVPLIYRVKGGSALAPKPHPEAGHDTYAWFSSPLRRYVDLVNQRQIAGLLTNGPGIEPLRRRDLGLLAEAFDRRYAKIILAQRALERFWALKYIEQFGDKIWEARVGRDNAITLEKLELRGKLVGSAHAQGNRLKVRAEEIDLIALSAKFVEAQ